MMRKLNLRLEKADLQREFLVLKSKQVKMSMISKRKLHCLMITSSEIQRDECRREQNMKCIPTQRNNHKLWISVLQVSSESPAG